MSSIGTGATIAASDKRLKENVDYIGDSPSGIRMYKFNYLGGDTRYRGVMADDLIDSHPDIIGKNNDGYYTVDYSQIDVDFEIVERD